MKRILTTILAAVTIVSAKDTAPVEKPEDWTPIVLDVKFVSVPKPAALELRKKFQGDDAAIAAAAKELDQLVANGKADMLAAPILRTRSDERVVSEDIDEVRYAIEYETPIIVENDSFSVKDAEKNGLEIAGVPTTFETRNTGYTVELEPRWNEAEGEVHIQHVLDHTFFNGTRKVTVEKQPGDVKVTVELPSFRKNRSQGTVSLKPGATALVGFFRDPANDQRMEMVTITVYREAKK